MAFDGSNRIEQVEAAFLVTNTVREINAIFHEKGEKFEEEDAMDALDNPPGPVHFPFLITGMAAVKDIMDAFDLTLVGIVFTTLFTVIYALTMFFWLWGKIKGRWWKKHIIRFLIRRAFLCVGIELLPIVKVIPTATIFVLMAHNKEKKIVKLMNVALEVLHKQGIGKA